MEKRYDSERFIKVPVRELLKSFRPINLGELKGPMFQCLNIGIFTGLGTVKA